MTPTKDDIQKALDEINKPLLCFTGDGTYHVLKYKNSNTIRAVLEQALNPRSGSFYAGHKPDGKFMALNCDGSGGHLFETKDDGLYISADGHMTVDFDWFIDAGYSDWVRIPVEFKFWKDRT